MHELVTVNTYGINAWFNYEISLLPKITNEFLRSFYYVHSHNAHLRQECHNSEFGIFELLVQKETFADALLTGTVS